MTTPWRRRVGRGARAWGEEQLGESLRGTEIPGDIRRNMVQDRRPRVQMSQANPAVGLAPGTRLGSVPNPAEDDTHLEAQGPRVNKKVCD